MVDDSSLVRLYYRATLEQAGFAVEQAINGIEAMEKVLEQPFDLLIVDVNMPRMDGLSFLRRAARAARANVASLPALVISTEAGAQDRDDARAAGANFYLVKPVSEADLLRHVAVLTGAPHERAARAIRHRSARTDRAGDRRLIALERDGSAVERIDRVFRAFHTLKGAAGVVELPAMSLALHAAEDLLAAIHGGRLATSPAIIDAALACLDQVSNWVDGFEGQRRAAHRAGEDARAMAERLQRASCPGKRRNSKRHRRQGNAGGDRDLPDWAVPVDRIATRDELPARRSDRAPGRCAICYQPLPGCFFNGDDPLRLMRKCRGCWRCRSKPREPWPAIADIDPYACNLRLQAISAAVRAEHRIGVPSGARSGANRRNCGRRPSIDRRRRRWRCDRARSARHRGADTRCPRYRTRRRPGRPPGCGIPRGGQRPAARAASRAGPTGRIRMFIGSLPARSGAAPGRT